jgi:preprotein translocase subunit SecA
VSNVKYQHAGYDEALATSADGGDVAVATAPPLHAGRREGRPQRPVPVRRGKKYKHCHGKF